MNEYPEHEKLSKVKDRSQAIGEFLEWLRTEQGVKLCKWGLPLESKKHGIRYGFTEQFYDVHKTTQEWLAEFYGIDLTKLEAEKMLMLEEMREANKH